VGPALAKRGNLEGAQALASDGVRATTSVYVGPAREVMDQELPRNTL
jgi:hypothetical protein